MMMKFDRSTPELLVPACLVIGAIVVYANKLFFRWLYEDNAARWKLIGHIKHLYIYPIEGGYRKEMKNVECSSTELTSYDYDNNILWRDSAYLIYSVEENPLSETVQKINLHNAKLVSLNTDILKNIGLQELRHIVYPDGTLTYANDCGDEKSDMLKKKDNSKTLRLGFFNKYAKYFVTQSRRYSKKKIVTSFKCLNPEFALFSLVNDRSVEDVKVISGNDNLTHLNFRPNFVIEANNFCEDEVEFLKIGQVEFENVVPCTVDDYVNIDPETGTVSHNKQPYLALSEYRKLKDVRPDISNSSDMPVFGITLDVSLPGKITVGDKVYAKFLNRR